MRKGGGLVWRGAIADVRCCACAEGVEKSAVVAGRSPKARGNVMWQTCVQAALVCALSNDNASLCLKLTWPTRSGRKGRRTREAEA